MTCIWTMPKTPLTKRSTRYTRPLMWPTAWKKRMTPFITWRNNSMKTTCSAPVWISWVSMLLTTSWLAINWLLMWPPKINCVATSYQNNEVRRSKSWIKPLLMRSMHRKPACEWYKSKTSKQATMGCVIWRKQIKTQILQKPPIWISHNGSSLTTAITGFSLVLNLWASSWVSPSWRC